jgi:hypothetical protein
MRHTCGSYHLKNTMMSFSPSGEVAFNGIPGYPARSGGKNSKQAEYCRRYPEAVGVPRGVRVRVRSGASVRSAYPWLRGVRKYHSPHVTATSTPAHSHSLAHSLALSSLYCYLFYCSSASAPHTFGIVFRRERDVGPVSLVLPDGPDPPPLRCRRRAGQSVNVLLRKESA